MSRALLLIAALAVSCRPSSDGAAIADAVVAPANDRFEASLGGRVVRWSAPRAVGLKPAPRNGPRYASHSGAFRDGDAKTTVGIEVLVPEPDALPRWTNAQPGCAPRSLKNGRSIYYCPEKTVANEDQYTLQWYDAPIAVRLHVMGKFAEGHLADLYEIAEGLTVGSASSSDAHSLP